MNRTNVSVDVHMGDEEPEAQSVVNADGERHVWLKIGWYVAIHVTTPEQVDRLRSALDELAALMSAEAVAA